MNDQPTKPPPSIRWLANETNRCLVEALGKDLTQIRPLGHLRREEWRSRDFVAALVTHPQAFIAELVVEGAGRFELKERLNPAAKVLRRLGVVTDDELDAILIAIEEVI